jgi:hypothetical protein
MSIQSASASFAHLKIENSGNIDKVDVTFSNGVKLHSLNHVTKAGDASKLPDNSLYIDSTGMIGVVRAGHLKPFVI